MAPGGQCHHVQAVAMVPRNALVAAGSAPAWHLLTRGHAHILTKRLRVCSVSAGHCITVIRKPRRGDTIFMENCMAASMGAPTEKENFEMKKLCLSLVLGIVAFGVGAARAQAQGAAAAPQIPMSKPPVTYGYDIRPQVLLDLDQLPQKFVPLAEAIPAEKYTWRS